MLQLVTPPAGQSLPRSSLVHRKANYAWPIAAARGARCLANGPPAALRRAPAPSSIVSEVVSEVLDLELDFRMGKLSEADYRELTAALPRRASALLGQADAADHDLGAHLEHEIAAARSALASRQPPSPHRDDRS